MKANCITALIIALLSVPLSIKAATTDTEIANTAGVKVGDRVIAKNNDACRQYSDYQTMMLLYLSVGPEAAKEYAHQHCKVWLKGGTEVEVDKANSPIGFCVRPNGAEACVWVNPPSIETKADWAKEAGSI
jgi:hypothetical protein